MDAINLSEAREAASEGMQRALDAAERRDDEWPERAIGFVHRYALTHDYFTVEEMTAEADRLGYGSPTGGQAWGAIIRCAARRNYIVNTHTTRPRMKGHGAPGPLWLSLVYVGSAA